MRDFLLLLKPRRTTFFLAVIALLASSAFNAGLTALAEPLIDNVLGSGTDVPSKAEKVFGFKEKMGDLTQWLEGYGLSVADVSDGMSPLSWAILAMFIFLGEAFFDFLGTYMLGRVGIDVVVGLRQSIIERVMGLSMRFYNEFNSGEILTRLNADVVRLQNAISVKLGEMTKEITRTFIYVIGAFYLDWKLSLTLILLVPAVGIPINIFTMKIRANSSRSQGFLGALSSRFKEVLVGIRIVKGFQKEPYEARKMAEINKGFRTYALHELRFIALTRPVMSAIGMVMILAFIVYGSIMIKEGQISSGQFITYVLVVYQLYQPIKRMARANSEIQQAVGILPRIQEILEWTNEIEEPAQPKRFAGYPEMEEVHFDNVHFSYERRNAQPLPVLHGVNLKVKRGTVVALVGSSGSGKSSLVNLVSRFYDVTAGAVRFNGLDIREMSKKDLRALVAIVTQDTVLFDDTVFNNIAYGLEHTTQAEVEAAARKAFAHHFIEELSHGYQTTIGENGTNLSGGQRQRLSIARAILANAPLLILDEATSALDTESEKEVQMALDYLMKTKTTLVIAHRLSTVRDADHIVVLNQGQIMEEGTHEGLMNQQGIYRRLIEMQQEGRHAL